MIISEKHKIIFIHIHKTAGQSITDYMEKNLPDSKPFLNKHDFAINGKIALGEEKWDEYFKFAFVRNPWDRLVSWYHMFKLKPPVTLLQKYVLDNSKNFEEFIKKCTDIIVDNDGIKSCAFNQLDYISDEKGKIIIDFIGKLENLEEDFKKIIEMKKLPKINLPHLNSYPHKDYKKYYSEETKEIIKKRFNKDIKFFGYKF